MAQKKARNESEPEARETAGETQAEGALDTVSESKIRKFPESAGFWNTSEARILKDFSDGGRIKVYKAAAKRDLFEDIVKGKAESDEPEETREAGDAPEEGRQEEASDAEEEMDEEPAEEETEDAEEEPEEIDGSEETEGKKKAANVKARKPKGGKKVPSAHAPQKEKKKNLEPVEEPEEAEEIEERPIVPKPDSKRFGVAEQEGGATPKHFDRGEIRKTVIDKAKESAELDIADVSDEEPASGVPLVFLEDTEKGNVFIGRKKAVFKKYGYEAALHIGRLEEQGVQAKNVYMDSLHPHVVFVCGARGSGKSYVLGVMAEEIARQNPNVGTVVIDPVGIFWSMKHPNKEEREIKMLGEWGLKPEGLPNLRVFIPEGSKSQTPKSTYDSTYSLPPSLLTADDWALTFGIERFSPTGLLLDISLKKVRQGYKDTAGKYAKANPDSYSLEEIITCLQSDSELNSREIGYKPDSIRALVSRFEAAKAWGVFSSKGTPLAELSREGQLSVIDTSFLDDSVTSLVVGILARRILAARKITTRREAAKRYKADDVKAMLETDIPPTWLYIDEAHTLIPSGNVKTPASEAIVEYVKQGRRPGCSLVFATQQPSAIDTRVLSQLDMLIAHKLVFDDDIKAVYRRIPTIVPHKYRKGTFLKTLPVGLALIADRAEETSRAFLMRIRPRMSQHEGREAEALDRTKTLSEDEVKKLMVELLLADLSREGLLEMEIVGNAVSTMNSRYKSNVKLDAVLDELEGRGVLVGQEEIKLPDAEKETQAESVAEIPEPTKAAAEKAAPGVEKTELLAIPAKMPEAAARALAERVARKKMLGLLGKAERVEEIKVLYAPVWKAKYEIFTSSKEFLTRVCYIDSLSGEFLHFHKGKFLESKGLAEIGKLDKDEIAVLKLLASKKELPLVNVIDSTGLGEGKARRIMDKFTSLGITARGSETSKGIKQDVYWMKKEFDIPPSEKHALLGSLGDITFERVMAAEMERPKLDRTAVPALLQNLWPGVIVKQVDAIYRPLYKAVLSDEKQRQRTIYIDGFTGMLL